MGACNHACKGAAGSADIEPPFAEFEEALLAQFLKRMGIEQVQDLLLNIRVLEAPSDDAVRCDAPTARR